MNKIGLLIPYFGKFPEYFELWLRSAESNTDVDFIILTDNIVRSANDNIIIKKCTFNEVVTIIQSKFNFKICIETPYDLCTFKPAYGYIFSDVLKKYEFWGHCDIDLIFGRLSDYLTNEILSSYDKILSHGHLCIYRNTNRINTMFMNKESSCIYYKDAFSTRRIWNNFDEYPYGVSRIAKLNNIPVFEAPIFADLDSFFFTFRKIYSYLSQADDNENVVQYFKWEKGILYNVNIEQGSEKVTELAYVHFQKREMDCRYIKEIQGAYYIAPNVFLPIKDYSTTIDLAGKHESNNDYCTQMIKKTLPSKNAFWKKIFSYQLWKRKIFLIKMRRIYKVLPYQFKKGGF